MEGRWHREGHGAGHRLLTRCPISPSSPLQVRMLNDQLMLLERTFLNPRAFPQELYYR